MNVDERIRQRAYEIWEAEGRPEGQEADHWQRARDEIEPFFIKALAAFNPDAWRSEARDNHVARYPPDPLPGQPLTNQAGWHP